MELHQKVDGVLFADALRAGAANLRKYIQTINNLNVFPIPDGDTGNNMLLTIMGGVDAMNYADSSVSTAARRAADGMLLSARGNSGVILSQLFDGIAKGLDGIDEADITQVGECLKVGVKHAYDAVMEPTEGTMLTVARCATEYADSCVANTMEDFVANYITEAKRTLDKTPDMLPVLKRAGVVDSGGAGLLYIAEGAKMALLGEKNFSEDEIIIPKEYSQDINLDLFTENSVLEYGYCTELLLRLQNSKTNPETFDVGTITDYLKRIGDSVVAFKTGSIVKIHVHTMTPDKVLSYCQLYGEFLTLKIENMSLQHNNVTLDSSINITVQPDKKTKKYGIAAVCLGEGIKQMFIERGADIIIDGGQTMNPSTEDFINAFKEINAETIIVLPNNSNVLLSAKQAAELYKDADVRVLESKTIGDGYAALSMMNPDAENADELLSELNDAMCGVVTAEISRCIRDAEIDGIELHTGDYVGLLGKDFISASADRLETTLETVSKLDLKKSYDICIVIKGSNVNADEATALEKQIKESYPGKEIFISDGKQEIYDYIIILQ